MVVGVGVVVVMVVLVVVVGVGDGNAGGGLEAGCWFRGGVGWGDRGVGGWVWCCCRGWGAGVMVAAPGVGCVKA